MVDHSKPVNVVAPAFTDANGDNQTVSATTPFPVTVTSGGTDQDVNLVGIDGVVPSVNAGAVSNGTLRTVLANNTSGTQGWSATYEAVAAGQTAQVLGATGAAGDYLSHIVVFPGTTSPGNVIIIDNATALGTFAGGASSVSNLIPFVITVGAYSSSGAWKITTGANVTVLAVGRFT